MELLEVTLQGNSPKRASSILPQATACHNPGMITRPSVDLNRSNTITTLNDPLASTRLGYPITFNHLGRRGSGPITLFASALPILKPWIEQIQVQQALKNQRTPVFQLTPAIQQRRFLYDAKLNHLVTFSK